MDCGHREEFITCSIIHFRPGGELFLLTFLVEVGFVYDNNSWDVISLSGNKKAVYKSIRCPGFCQRSNHECSTQICGHNVLLIPIMRRHSDYVVLSLIYLLEIGRASCR